MVSEHADRYLETLNSISSSEFQPSQAPRIGQVVLEKRLNRISDFFGGVILAFVLQDLSLLLVSSCFSFVSTKADLCTFSQSISSNQANGWKSRLLRVDQREIR